VDDGFVNIVQRRFDTSIRLGDSVGRKVTETSMRLLFWWPVRSCWTTRG
jgi:hypothetical protein